MGVSPSSGAFQAWLGVLNKIPSLSAAPGVWRQFWVRFQAERGREDVHFWP